ncbi:MAG: cell division protein FtsZ [Micavibrio aeruginosavorus]|uniref:Cell division protein FtsZ n=1 Tax=Micavibrio aeruginosavorus TaxID=349221 RepID=A0A7T5UHJ6_9BACT|nr:MAG: cell division protein FtsZ [Micavibrio aeruginosavorus]
MINVRIQHKEVHKLSPRIAVIGVGGAGGNAVNNMIGAGLEGCEFVVCNTDAQAIEGSLCETRVQLGVTVTGGLGAGARPEVGRSAAEESLDDVMRHLEGANMVFITAGMGGGTGTGAAPIIARACRDKGILTVGVVTKPFHFEGTTRMRMAEAGIEEMQQHVDTLIVIPNQNLFRVANEKTSYGEAFRMADSVLQSAVRSVTDLIVMPGEINLDFADIRTVMAEMGKAMMGAGEATGDGRAIEAAEKAINNPLLDDVSMKGARAVIINISGGTDLTLFEVDEACNRIRDEVDPNANIIVGSTYNPAMEGVMRVSIVATGIDAAEVKKSKGNFGPHIINALTAQQQQGERRVERAQPQATSSAVDEPPVSAYARQPYHAPAMPQGVAMARSAATVASRPVTAPSYVPVQQPAAMATARRVEEVVEVAGGDLFDQVQPYEVAVKKPEAAYAPAPAYAGQGGTHEVASQSVRGAVYNNAFIPPQPVEVPPESRSRDNMATGYGPQFTNLTASRTNAVTEQASAQGYSLRPPVSAAAPQPKKRNPSIFERFTSQLRHHAPQAVEETAEETVSVETGLRASQRPLQGSLNIEAPVAARPAEPADDELDIPAFLRRQAN